MAILQVKNLDNYLYAALKQRAQDDNRSVSQEVVTIIQSFLSQKQKTAGIGAARALLRLAGSWEDTRSAENIIADIRKARRNTRKSISLD
jgi:plasmid stability protein